MQLRRRPAPDRRAVALVGCPTHMTLPPPDLAAHVARHGAGLRQLALELAGDSGADDALQQTWLAAMLHWPRHDASIGGWLATTLRNVVRGSRRQQRRREQREQIAATARGEAGEDHASVLARGEVAQRLIAAVLALDPVHGDTIWQRFFEDRTPRAIAKASGVPVGTVKSRLKRGLAMLRERLAEHDGADWRGGFAAAFGLRAAVTGVVVMATWTKVAVGGAVAAALLAAALWWPAPGDVVPRGDSHGAAPAALAAGVGTRTSDVVRDAAEHERLAAAASQAPPAAGVARCSGRVIDAATKAPLQGATVILRRSMRSQDEPTDASSVTRDDGAFVFDFASDGVQSVRLWFRGPEHVVVWGELSPLEAGQDDELGDFELVRGRRLSGRITDEQGVPLPRGTLLRAMFLSPWSGKLNRSASLDVAVDVDGAFTLAPAVPFGGVEFEIAAGQHELRERIDVTASEPASVVLTARRRASIRGVVVDGDGSPLAGVRLVAWPGDAVQSTAGDGTFTLPRPNHWAPATAEVRVVHAPEFLVSQTKDVPWNTTDLRIVLVRTAPVPIEVIDDAGAVVERFGVVLQRDGTDATPRGTVLQRGEHAGGRLDVEGVDPGRTSLRVVPVDPQLSPSACVEIATNEPRRFVLARRLPCTVEVRCSGQPVAGAQVEILFGGPDGVRDHQLRDVVEPHRGERAWIPGGDAERVAEARTDPTGVASLLRDAAPGRYTLQVRVDGQPPFRVADPVFPAVVEVPGVGAVAERPGIAGRVQLRGHRRGEAFVRLTGPLNRIITPQPDGTFRVAGLTAGRYRIGFGGIDASTREVEVRDGETTVVDFDFADHPAAVFHGRLVRNGALPAGLTAELLRVVAGQRPATAGSAPVGADGVFTIGELQEGTYRVALRTPGTSPLAMPALFAETFVIAAGEQVHVDLPLPKHRLVVRLQRADGSVARGTKVLTRCDGVQWPSFAMFAAESDGVMVFDPAPMLAVEFAAYANKVPVWSVPVVMPPDRSEYEVTVVLPD